MSSPMPISGLLAQLGEMIYDQRYTKCEIITLVAC